MVITALEDLRGEWIGNNDEDTSTLHEVTAGTLKGYTTVKIRRPKDDGRVPWAKRAREVHDHVRAVTS